MAMKVTLHHRQKAGDQQTEYTDYKEVEMTATGDGKTFEGIVPAELLYTNEVQWYVNAAYGPGQACKSEETITSVTPSVPKAETAAPLVITEVAANPESKDDGKYSYFEVYNQTDKPINLGYFNVFYYYDYPSQTVSQSGKTWKIDFDKVLQPQETMVYWLDNGNTSLEQFNQFYGTKLELNKNIIKVNYGGLHESNP